MFTFSAGLGMSWSRDGQPCIYLFYIFTFYLSLCPQSAERTLFRKPAVLLGVYIKSKNVNFVLRVCTWFLLDVGAGTPHFLVQSPEDETIPIHLDRVWKLDQAPRISLWAVYIARFNIIWFVCLGSQHSAHTGYP